MIKKEIDDAVEKNFKEIDKAIENGDLNKSIRLLELQAEFFYKSNICYCSDILEQKFNTILCKFEKKERLLDLNSKKVIFYDYFALENRGLALIYLKGLVKNGYEVVYISYACKIQCLSRIQEILKSKKHKMIFLSTQSDYRTLYCELYNVFITERPMHAFLYTYPSDVVGIGVFQNLPIDIKRYQINLTDHAYWLGVNAFDYCIEFRNYGIYISEKYRHISSSKILVQPYYPECNSSEDYGGIPFTVKTNQLIMFSGGSIYKTLDNENTFYDLVEKLLLKYDNLIFWYASETTCASLRHLINTYPNRVYHTKERKDIYQVLCHIDIYLNTYPISGGLMLQYAAIAGKVPFTLVHDDDAYGVLLDNSEVYYKDGLN